MMSKLAAWITVMFVVGVVALASFGPPSQSQVGSAGSRGGVASAATVAIPYNPAGVIDQNDPTPTPSPPPGPPTPAPPVSRTVQLGAYNDASVVSGGMWSADQNLGGWTDLAVGPRSGGMFRSYLRFYVAALPSGVQIDSAALILRPTSGGLAPVPVEADFVQDDWTEDTITWNQQPLATYRTGVAIWKPGSMDPLTMDVTPAVQQWYACGGGNNSGLELSSDLAQSWVDFGSRKSTAPPALQVTYETATTPPNCSAPPAASVNLAPPSVLAPSTTGALIGSFDPTLINNPALLVGTPYGALSIPRPPVPTAAAAPTVSTPVTSPPIQIGGSSSTGTGSSTSGTTGTGP